MSTTATGSTSSSSFSNSIGATQSSSFAPASGLQFFNHTLPVKLDRSNYVIWRSQIDNVIYANGFENFIEGLSVCPEKTVPTIGVINPEFVNWRRQDRLILSWIYSTLTPEVMAQIVGHTTSSSTWKALEKIFSSSSRARLMQLRLQLQTTKKTSISMIDFIMKIKSLCDNLAAIGEPVTNQDQIMNLLAGLGSDYNAVVTSISTRDNQLTLEDVHSLLLTFEHRLEQRNSVDETGVMSANFAQNNKYTAQSSMSAMLATTNTVADNSWYLDSGATHHMTQNTAGLSNITPYTGSERVTIGNGKQIPISHVASSYQLTRLKA
ncbi:hypothetical protein UlMin_043114 [Ulmus minor]